MAGVYSQSTLPLRADTVLIEKVGGNANLKLKDASRDSVGGIYVNIGGGVLRAIRTKKLNDTTYIIGVDTIRVGKGGTATMDSVLFATNYRLDTVKNNLRALIAVKLNIADTTNKWINNLRRRPGTDTVEMLKGGSWQAVYKDSIGSSGGGGTVTQVNTGYGLTGGPITGVGTVKIDTTGSNPVVTTSKLNDTTISLRAAIASKWPAEEPYGIIYNKNNWSDGLNDFAINTLGGSTAQMAVNGNYIDYTVSSIDWDNYISILPIRPTILPNWSITVDFKMITAPNANTVGFGLGTKKIIGGNGDVLCYINTTNGGGSGTLAIARGDGAFTWNTASSFTVHQNDIIRLNVAFDDSIIVFTANNLTTGGSGSVSYTNTLNSSQAPISLLSNWALIGHSNSTPCTWQIQKTLITSKTKRNANIVVLGDSKTQGAFADFFATRYGVRLGNTYPSSIIYASGNAKISDYLTYMQDELTSLNGVTYIMCIGSNDFRGGALFADVIDNYTKLTKILQGGGARVLHIVLPEDSTAGVSPGIGLTAFKDWVASNYANDYVNVWDVLSTSNVLKAGYQGDHVHPNEAANKSIDSLIVLSGKIIASPVRGLRYRINDNFVKYNGDSIYVLPVEKALYRVHHNDLNAALRTGVLADNGTSAGAAPANGLPFNPVSGSIFTATGLLAVNGVTGGIAIVDRTSGLNNFSLYADGDQFRVFNTTNGIDAIKIETTLKTLFVNNTGTTSLMNPLATVHIGGNTFGTAGHAPLLVDSCTLLVTPEAYAIEVTADSIYWTNKAGVRVALNRVGSGGSGISSLNSQTGGTQTFANGTGITVNSSSNTHTISLNSSYITSGTYTPTLTNEGNVASSTAYPCQYMRVGNVVTVSGKITVDYTSTGLSSVGISLPIASSIGNDYEVAGTATAEVNNSARIQGDPTNDRAQFYINTGSSAGYDYFFVFTYQIL